MYDQEESKKAPSFDWVLWVKWILASTLGWVVGWAFVDELAIGAVVGLAQWLVLRSLIRGHGWWILATAGGWSAGAAVVPVLFARENNIFAEAVIGASVGLAQWLVLRRQVYQAWWWAVLSTLGWAVGLTGTLGSSWAGAVAGAATGVGLEFLLRRARMETEGSSTEEG